MVNDSLPLCNSFILMASGEAEAGSAGEQPAEEYPDRNSLSRWVGICASRRIPVARPGPMARANALGGLGRGSSGPA